MEYRQIWDDGMRELKKYLLFSLVMLAVVIFALAFNSFMVKGSTVLAESANTTNIEGALSTPQGQVVGEKISPGVSGANQSCNVVGFNISVGYNPSPTGSPLYASWRICPSGNCATPTTISEWDTNVESLLINGIKEFNITPPGNLSMNKNEIYLFALRSSNGGSNYIWFAGSTTQIYDTGDYRLWSDSSNSGTFTQSANSAEDMAFKVFCQGASAPVPSAVMNTNLVNNSQKVIVMTNFTFNETFTSSTHYLNNCTLYTQDSINQSFLNLDTSNTIQINLTDVPVEKDYNLSINCSSDETNSSSGLYKFDFDNLAPRILNSFTNGSTYTQNDMLAFTVNFTDFNVTSYNISVLDINSNVWSGQQFISNGLSTGFIANYTSFGVTALGNFSIVVNSRDWLNNTAQSKYFYSVLSASSASNVNLTGITNDLETIKAELEGLKMLPWIILYCVFLILGYVMFQSGNSFAGFILIGLTIPWDFFFIVYLLTTYVYTNLYTGIFRDFIGIWAVCMIFWILGKLMLPFMIKFRVKA